MTPWKSQSLFLASRDRPTAATALKEGLRCSKKVTGTIAKAFANRKVIQNMVTNVEHWGRGKTGPGMRPLGADWKSQVGACLIFELVDLRKRIGSNDEVEERGVVDKYETFLQIIEEKGLEGAFEFKGLLNVSPPPFSSSNSGALANCRGYQGHDLVAEYALCPGAWVEPILNQCLQHQLDNPPKSKHELLQWVRENRRALLGGLECAGVGEG
ncbi:hypothetical protein HOY80DRAFT_1114325 [Tuber brumale]|nr:hypothetical protein HOY80DRAFT_1114325 [Tuber brumale]